MLRHAVHSGTRCLRRRVVAVTVGLGLLAGPLPGDGQSRPKVPRIGLLCATLCGDMLTGAHAARGDPAEFFIQAMQDIGYVNGQNVIIDSRAGGGPVYWEGAAEIDGGRGYLELTGYFRPLKL